MRCTPTASLAPPAHPPLLLLGCRPDPARADFARAWQLAALHPTPLLSRAPNSFAHKDMQAVTTAADPEQARPRSATCASFADFHDIRHVDGCVFHALLPEPESPALPVTLVLDVDGGRGSNAPLPATQPHVAVLTPLARFRAPLPPNMLAALPLELRRTAESVEGGVWTLVVPQHCAPAITAADVPHGGCTAAQRQRWCLDVVEGAAHVWRFGQLPRPHLPAAVLVTPDGRVALLDDGAPLQIQASPPCGGPQLLGWHALTATRIDPGAPSCPMAVWSVGVALCMLLAGPRVVAWEGSSSSPPEVQRDALLAHVPQPLCGLLLDACSADAWRRPADPLALLPRLRAAARRTPLPPSLQGVEEALLQALAQPGTGLRRTELPWATLQLECWECRRDMVGCAARMALACLHRLGQGGKAADPRRAAWLAVNAASVLNSLEARCDLDDACTATALWIRAECCMRGWGVPVDAVRGAQLWRQAAELGHACAQYEWGECLVIGYGVAAEPGRGHTWILQAAQRGHVLAEARARLVAR